MTRVNIAQVKVENLLAAVNTAIKTIDDKYNTAYSHLWMKSDIFETEITSFNGETGVTTETQHEDSSNEVEYSVPATTLIRWLNLHNSDTILTIAKLTYDGDEEEGSYYINFATLDCNSQITLAGLHLDSKPCLPNLYSANGTTNVDAKQFTNTLTRVNKFKAKSGYPLNSVNLLARASVVTLTATDGYKVAQGSIQVIKSNIDDDDKMYSVTINPNKLNLPKKGKIYIQFCHDFVVFISENGVQFTRTSSMTYPTINISPVVQSINVVKKNLVDGVKKITPPKPEVKSKYWYKLVALHSDSSKLYITPQEESIPNSVRIFTLRESQPSSKLDAIIINLRHLNEVLRTLGQGKTITLGIYQWSTNIRCLAVTSNNITYLISEAIPN